MSADTEKEDIPRLASSANAQISDLAESARMLASSNQEGSYVAVAVLINRIEELADAACTMAMYGTVSGDCRRVIEKGSTGDPA